MAGVSASQPEPWPAVVYALGFSWRKRALLRQFLASSQIRFVRQASAVPDGAMVAVWASGPHGARPGDTGVTQRYRKIYIEDGFLRSVGLGADLVRPLSWVVDRTGIYYDATQPSDLEQLLQTAPLDGPVLNRARALRRQLVASRLTKFNVGHPMWQRHPDARQLKLVLVAGQVETDAAIRWGAPGIATNLALLKAARLAEPNAWLIYKSHPDVVAGLRGAGADESLAHQYCNEIVTDVSMAALLDAVDAVHVLSSLAGFEALLRKKEVVCHGAPFYAGWGLTHDHVHFSRRTRRLGLDQLVAGALIHYPCYVDRQTGELCQAEQALADLLAWQRVTGNQLPWWRKLIRPLIRHR